MNLILLHNDDFIPASNRVRLTGRRLRHIGTVHRVAVGDELRIGLLNGSMGIGRITRLDSDGVEMKILLSQHPPSALPVTLILALPRPKMLKRVLISASSMGVKRIVLLHSCRVEKSFWQSPVLQEDCLREQLILGLEQARDTIMPELLLRRRFKPFVEDELPEIIRDTLPLVAHPIADAPCPCGLQKPVTLAVGPEGGFVAYEINLLMQCGFQAIHLGERILRVETAVPALLSRIF